MSTTAERELILAFAPVHKRAFGVAAGCAFGLAVFLLTIATLIVASDDRLPLELLAVYFTGYEVSLVGAFIGAAWAFFAGFVAGWFAAFVRNFVIAAWIFIVRTRAELSATRDFLDHI
jgi:hypothetical protein